MNQAGAQTLGSSDIQSILSGISQGQQVTPSTGQSSSQSQSSSSQPVTSSSQTLQPAMAPAINTTPSTLEQLFSDRAGTPLQQFGYDVFGQPGAVMATQIGSLQDSYILGVGDQIQVIMVGHENATYVVTVDRDGRIVLLNLPPVVASGRTLGEVRAELSARIAAQFLNTKSFITVSTVRQISVLVTGEVAVPGVRTLTGLNTVLDALVLSGGIKKTGSLRGVYILRGSRRLPLDLYSVITHGTISSIGNLTEGDRIVVPPLGGTVAVAGQVRRPAIYELPPGAPGISSIALAELAGGQAIAGSKRLSKLELQRDGKMRLVSQFGSGLVRNGEVLFVYPERDTTQARVYLNGSVAVSGARPLSGTPTLSKLIRDTDDLGSDAYTLFAVVIHHDPDSNFMSVKTFSVQRVLAHADDMKLSDEDNVYIFSRAEALAVAAGAAANLSGASTSGGGGGNGGGSNAGGGGGNNTQQSGSSSGSTPSGPLPIAPSAVTANTAAAALQTQPAASATAPTTTGAGAAPVTVPGAAAPAGALGGIGFDPRLGAVQPVQSGQTNISTGTAAVMLATGTAGKTASVTSSGGAPSQTVQTISLDALATKLDVMTSDLVRAASDDLVWVSGEVRTPGAYLAEKDTSLQALIDAAGGTQRQADLSAVEVTSTQIDAETGTSRTVRTIYSASNADFAKVALRPLDSIRIRPVFSDRKGGSVIISGEVRFPGTFDIVRGERLSSVLARAGGLTDQAYPLGAVFTRQSAAIAEADANQRMAKSLESAIVMLSSIPTTTPTTLTYLQSLVQELRTLPAIGRISVTADPVALAVKPEQDIALQPGDTIYIPEHPSTVLVSGEVLNSGSFAYRADLTVDDYVKLAGGETDAAEDSLTFIVLPDGTARPRDSGWISFGSDHIPPGSVVVIPRDPAPFNLTTFLINYSDIISKIALTAASLAVINK